ncbi:MAG: hypothetical protein WEB57_13700 [Pseudohongiellaceae bacterium]
MNVKVHYLYRDAGNFKQFGTVVFSNQQGLPENRIVRDIESCCEEGIYFDVSAVDLPPLYFEVYNPALDHDWHELESIELCSEAADDDKGRDIGDFINRLREAQ